MITFPAEVPAHAAVDTSRWARQWLCDGEIRTWGGATGRVLSPVCTVGADGAPAQLDLGPVAMLDRAAALEALAAARTAWDHGRGAWPTMRVGERIERMQTFVAGMRAVREDLVRLLMLEIGKTRADSETEVDRTALYIDDTIAALKELEKQVETGGVPEQPGS